jgi:hypothetical protein
VGDCGPDAVTAVAIAGMHRSGTSFVAEVLAASGLHLGPRLLAGDGGNPRGYFEDEDFLALQREALTRACPAGEVGWPDWGWTEAERLDGAVLDGYRDAMASLAAQRRHPTLWGWKDPRTTLLLDRWLDVIPDLRVLGVVREPWLVAASVGRLPSEVLRSRPEVAVRIWEHHNERLVDFASRHPDRCAFVSTMALAAEPTAAVDRVARLLDVDLVLTPHDGRAICQGRRADAHADQPDVDGFQQRFPAATARWRALAVRAEA